MAANQIEEIRMSRQDESSIMTPVKSADVSELQHSFFLDEGNVLTDSGSFFSQLDSMIAAVKVESNALDSMREKLKEVDNLRTQIAIFSKRVLEADQTNLNLKSTLLKLQESSADVKQQKAELESQNAQLRQELNRVKDNWSKEKSTRQAAQTEIISLRDQLHQYEKSNENYEREVKVIPALQESNEILKNDLANLRRKFREEKAQMTNYIKGLEQQLALNNSLRGDVRSVAMKLLEMTNPVAATMPHYSQHGASSSGMMVQQSHQPYSGSYSNSLHQNTSVFSATHDDSDDNEIHTHYENSVDEDLDIHSFIPDDNMMSQSYLSGAQSVGASFIVPPSHKTVVMGPTNTHSTNAQVHHNQTSSVNQQEMQQAAAARNGGDCSGKKKKKKATARQSSISLPRLIN